MVVTGKISFFFGHRCCCQKLSATFFLCHNRQYICHSSLLENIIDYEEILDEKLKRPIVNAIHSDLLTVHSESIAVVDLVSYTAGTVKQRNEKTKFGNGCAANSDDKVDQKK